MVGDTSISEIDGIERGVCSTAAIPSRTSLAGSAFEEVAHLVLFGEMPDATPARRMVRRAVAMAASAGSDRARGPAEGAGKRSPPGPVPDHDDGRRLPHPGTGEHRARRPVAAACQDSELDCRSCGLCAIRHLEGADPMPPRDDLGYAANFLHQATGRTPSTEEATAFEASLVVQAEHGLHAAAFAALVVISTGADLGSAVLAGMGALSGARHGGANQLAFEMLSNNSDGPDNAASPVGP